MTEPVIRVENLSKRYRIGSLKKSKPGGFQNLSHSVFKPFYSLRDLFSPVPDDQIFWALKDISFELNQGEILGVIGRNGAGKSTLLKILSRITYMTSGRAEMIGRVRALLEVGTGFHQEMTGRENVYLNGSVLGMTKDEINAKFDEIVDFSGVEKFIDTPVKRYSSGMYVRLAFAVAAHLEPDILIIDEVLAVGDADFQAKCIGKISSTARAGRTVLFVSHNMASVKTLCDRAILLEDGEIVLDGHVDQAVYRYLSNLNQLIDTDGIIPDDFPRTLRNGNPIGTEEAYLRYIGLEDRDNERSRQFAQREPLTIVLRYEVKAPIEEAVLEVGVSTIDGIRVMTTYSIDAGGQPMSLAPGMHEFQVQMDSNLVPGEYVIDTAMHHAHRTNIDWIERALKFRITNLTMTGDYELAIHERISTKYRGFVTPPSTWVHKDTVSSG